MPSTIASVCSTISSALATFFQKTGGEITGRVGVTLPTTTQSDTAGEQPSVKLSSSTIQTGTNPSTAEYFGIYFTDKTKLTNYDGRLACLECAVQATGRVGVTLGAYQFTSGKSSWIGSLLNMSIMPDGTKEATVPNPPSGDNSTKIATTSWVTTFGASYLPLAGGTMTGSIILSSVSTVAKASSDSTYVQIFGGTAYNKGAYLRLNGKDLATYLGSFSLVAHDGSNSKQLVGKPDGTLTWDGTSVALSTDLASYLPLAGGTMTGPIVRSGELVNCSSDTSWVRINGGSLNSNGAYILLYGKSHSSNAGQIQIKANDGANSATLVGKPDGQLTWGGTSKAIAVGLGEHTFSNIGAHGYLTSSATTLCFYLPILVAGTSVSITTLTASVRVGTGGYTTPGGSTAESIIPTGVTQSVSMSGGIMRVVLTKSAGWNATNNTALTVQITSLKFTVS